MVKSDSASIVPRRLLVVCPYPFDVAPSQRLKFEQYYPCFREAGWQLTLAPFVCMDFWKIIYRPGNVLKKIAYCLRAYFRRLVLLPQVAGYDVVYVHLWGTPFGPPVYEWILRKLAHSLVYDIDDLVYSKVDSLSHRFVSHIKGRRKPLYLMRSADHVITCTPYLEQFVRTMNDNVTDISSTVDTSRYQRANQYGKTESLVIGWSGSLSTSKYFYLLAPVLRRLKEKHCFKLVVMGDESVSIDGLDIEALPWTAAAEIATLQRFDIGVYPLPDEQWVYGKSGLKAIQYMALGIPTVATAIGANHRVIEDGLSGLLVKTEEEWLQALERLLSSVELRRSLGEAGRQRVEALFSVKANQATYLRILESMRASR